MRHQCGFVMNARSVSVHDGIDSGHGLDSLLLTLIGRNSSTPDGINALSLIKTRYLIYRLES